MALQVWLPLNGSLKNNGLSQLKFSNENTSTITVNSSGKIGSCYERTAINTAGRIKSNTTINLSGDISMCCWAKVTSTVGDTANGLVSNHSHSNNTGFGITVKQISENDYRISCSTGNGTNRTYFTYYGTTNIKDSWHHLCLTYDNSLHIFKLWVDGICEKEQSYTNSSISDYIMVFDWSTTYNSNNYRPACSINDVRIYDHCLSEKEIREISKGMVLHYKLEGSGLSNGLEFYDYIENTDSSYIDTEYVIGPSNLKNIKLCIDFAATNNQVGNRWWVHGLGGSSALTVYAGIGNGTAGDSVRFTYGNGTQDITTSVYGNIGTRYNYTIDLKNKTYVVKDCNGNTLVNLSNITINTPSSSYSPYVFAWRRGNNGTLGYAHSDKIYSYSLYDDGVLVRNLIPCTYNGVAGMWDSVESKFYGNKGSGTFTLGNKLSLIPLTDDSSGYRNNATVTGILTTSTESPRYNKCATVQSSGWLSYPFPNIQELTYSLWFKRNRVSYSNREMLMTGWYGLSFELNPNNTLTFRHQLTSGTFDVISNKTFTSTSEWYHIVLTRDGLGSSKIYVNGVLDKSGTNTNLINYTVSTANIFTYNNSSSYQFQGSISDFRIYSTALSADDVKELYNTSAFIYNNGTLASYEFIEEKTSQEILKNGIVKSSNYEEGVNIAAIYSDNVETKQLTEI